MPEGKRGIPLPPDENILRVLTHPDWWLKSKERISSAAFNYPIFSGDVESMTTEKDSLERHRQGCGLARFNVGEADKIPVESCHEPENGNDAHAHIYNDGSVKKRKRKAKDLALLATKGILKIPD